MSPRAKTSPGTRHVVSINDLSNNEIEAVFELANSYLRDLSDKATPYRVARSTDVGANRILASLFFEPSTRTRLSFESAMLRLGGGFITSADPATSSAAKGESLADSVRVIANYADLIVIRHPRDGAARLAAEYSAIPVINGGDGSHEHPTQTLCDIYTLKQRNRNLKNLNVAISGDLKGSRTIHSFVYALARFGANILLMPAKGMELPKHVDSRLRDEFKREAVEKSQFEKEDSSIDALYRTPEGPHQLSLIPNIPEKIVSIRETIDKIDVVYVTRFQKERWAEKEQHYPTIDAKFLEAPKFSKTSVMHPLPRVGELDASFDTDKRAVYFQQAAYGVPVRMALISLLLRLKDKKSLQPFFGGFEKSHHTIYDQPIDVGIHCINDNCIVRDPKEKQYARNKFYVVKHEVTRQYKLRCVYCETDIDEEAMCHFVFGDKKKHTISKDIGMLLKASEDKIRQIIIFQNEAEALKNGYHLKEKGENTHPSPRPAYSS